MLTESVIAAVVQDVPADWLAEDVEGQRQAYVTYLMDRLAGPRPWLEEAEHARTRS